MRRPVDHVSMGGGITRFAALRQRDRVYGKVRTDMPRRRYKPEEIVAQRIIAAAPTTMRDRK
jgi:hypothetical protein